MNLRMLLLGVVFCLVAPAALAQGVTDKQLDDLSTKCRSRQPISYHPTQTHSEFARKIRDVAIKQHETFVGNRVDHTGRMEFFGHAETESDQEIDRTIELEQLPWRQVLSHWESVSGTNTLAAAHERLSVWYYRGALDPTPPARLPRSEIKLSVLLDAIQNGVDFSRVPNADRVKAAIAQSLVRASLSDVPWSAVFISHVMKMAEVSGFTATAGHVTYIREAVQQSLKDVGVGSGRNYYRACDPTITKPRVGDLYCYHRHVAKTEDPYVQPEKSLFRSVFRELTNRTPVIKRTHCDIVVDINNAAKKVVVIGGNVQNSVTRKTLNLTEQYFLSSSQGTPECEAYNPDKRGSYAPNCNLNKQEWFVLLQARS
ncbi:DUF2272 domain-containing protein [Bradyrhizobium sp. AUGA SZCCT0177]|uniref:DUF2272 domain-containing protein n=1 Tax=Bradyrhizobium sp. AUGA SZCCT0177 TaxID=2807665 RepID=UPI001BA76B6B|nr:DUF2272 domain-containing protein [Bradyrhizobium sp. AUGA SZCCT0177]MBR1282821.1 DUF2272 domain-containing protein [Bradyrhizobium sp. AUGA SZCCT0177]